MANVQAIISCTLSWIILTFCIFGIVGNCLSIYVFRHSTMRSAINILLAGLSIIDLAMVILVIPSFVVTGLSECYNELLEVIPYIICFAYPLTLMMQSCSVWTFLLITFERYIAVCKPLQAPRYCSTGNSKKSFLIVCLAAVLYNLPRFFEYSFYFDKQGDFKFEENLQVDFCYKLMYYTILYLITHFVGPFSILAFTNAKMITEIYKARKERNRLLCNSRERREQNTTIMMVVIVFVFAVCNCLLFILNIIQAVDGDFNKRDETKVIAYLLNDLSNLLVVINSSTNCIFYYLFSERYRRLCKYLVGIIVPPRNVVSRRDSGVSTQIDPSARTALIFRRETVS